MVFVIESRTQERQEECQMKSSLVRRSTVLALALVLVACTGAFAVPFSAVEIETNLKVQSNAGDQLLPLSLNTESHTVRFRAQDSGKWILHLDAAASGNKAAIGWNRPRFRAQLVAPPATFDVWGGGYDVGGAQADAAELIVLGSLGTRPLAWGGMANAVPAGQMKIRSSFNVADTKVTAYVHQLATRTNLEAYADYKLDAATIGGVARIGFEPDPDDNTSSLAGFVKTNLSGVDLGGSVGVRFGKSVSGDNLGLGVNAETKLQDGAMVLAGEFVNRQKNFYEPNAQDAGFQSGVERFRSTGGGAAVVEGNLIRFTGTWLGEANKSRPALSVLHSTSEGTLTNLKGPAFQGIFQISNDGTPNAQTMVVARAGTRFLENNLWAVGELKVTKDDDGVGSIDGVAGKDSRTDLRGRVRYNFADAGYANWFALGIFEASSTKDAADKVGSTNKYGAELWYDSGKVRVINGLTTSGKSSDTKRDNRLYAQFLVKM